jgi:small nuclear ribonucleoprotein (snRNP)-like protein
MIRIEELEQLSDHIGKRVTVQSTTGARYRGKLTAVNDHSVTLTLDDREHRVLLADLADVLVHVGGDWVSYSGHSERSRTARIAFRLSAADLELVKDAAAQRDASVSDYIRAVLSRDAGISQQDGRRRGELHPGAKLTAEQVRAIRADDRPDVEIAKPLGVTCVQVGKIRRGQYWAEEGHRA